MTKRSSSIRDARRLLLGGAFLFAVLVLLARLAGHGAENPWDDAYFFKRIALNAVDHHTLAWNVSDGPVYGSTSLAFQLLAVAVVSVSRSYYFAIVKLLACAFELGLLALYLESAAPIHDDATYRAHAERGIPFRGKASFAAASGLALIVWACPLTLGLIDSGMDFHLGFLVLAATLFFTRRKDDAWRAGVGFALCACAVYLVRPDAVLLPVASLILYDWFSARRLPWRTLLATAAGIALICLACTLLFGTPVPLSFYLKSRSLSNYGAQFIELSRPYKYRNILTFALFAAPLIFVALHRRKPWTFAALGAAGLFCAFHFYSTVEVMGYQARYYLPALVPLGFAAIEAVPEFRRTASLRSNTVFVALHALAMILLIASDRVWTDSPDLDALGRVSIWAYAGQVVAFALWLVCARARHPLAAPATASALLLSALAQVPSLNLEFANDAALLERHIDRFTTTRGVRAVRACLPQPLQIFHSEIGVPGLLFPDSNIIDFAGLMSKQVALHGFDMEDQCKVHPQAIFLPHRVYVNLRQRVEASRCLRDYTRVVAASSSPLFVRNDLVGDFRRCAQKIGDPWITTATQ